jgi:hypothetical protein
VRSLLTMMMIAAIATPACAQMAPGMAPNIMGETRHLKTDVEINTERDREKAYKSGIGKIPDQNAKVDPWGNVRGAATPQSNQTQRPASK